jgi:hypothetical protein
MKRGETQSVLFYLMAMIITLIVIVGIFLVIRSTAKKTIDDAPCAAQILGHSVAVKLTKDLAAPTINCPSRRIAKEVQSEEEGKKLVADQMLQCWDQWGKGKLKLFGEKPLIYCHICSTATVQGVPELGNFGKYLDETPATPTQTYSQYLRGEKSGTFFDKATFPALSEGGALAPLRTEKPIAVIFFYAKGQYKIDELRNKLLQPEVAGTSGAVTGAAAAAGSLYAIGTVLTATGVGSPFGVVSYVVGGVIGAGAGSASVLAQATSLRADASVMTVVVARPLDEQDIGRLGCDYAPVSN